MEGLNLEDEGKEIFEKKLEPKNLAWELKLYQTHLGKGFSLRDLLYLKEIESRAMIAAALSGIPEMVLGKK